MTRSDKGITRTKEPKIVYNAIRTPDGTVLESTHRHDYKTHMDKNGFEYMVDGGISYLRRTLHKSAMYTELSLYDDSPHEKIREVFKWGTYGESGKEPYKQILLKDMSTKHIEAIILDAYKDVETIMMNELNWRGLE